MQRLMIGFKRFIKNKNTVTILGIIACLGILYWVYNARIQKKIAPVSVPYAVRDIGPGIQITSDMVSTKKVPGGIVSKNTIMNTKDVIGKYVSNKAVIPKNSIFYTTTVVNWEDLPSSLYEDIPVGNTIVALPVTMDTTYGNSIYPGNYIDLYFVSNKKTSDGDKLMLGKFIESIKVLAVTSSDGKSVFETEKNPGTPSYLIFSVPEDLHLLLRKASYLNGTIFPVPRNAEYSKNPKETRVVSTFIQTHILDQTVDVQEEDDKLINGEIEIIGGDANNEGTE